MTNDQILDIASKDLSSLTLEAQDVLKNEMTVRNLILELKTDSPITKNKDTTTNIKSFEFALLFAFLFGPLGLFYVSITAGIIMIAIAIIGFITLDYLGLSIAWFICIVLIFILVKRPTNKSVTENKISTPNGTILEQLSQLHSLKEKNVITEDIYEKERQKLLSLLK